jgi:ketosteroid isomerase-like protein
MGAQDVTALQRFYELVGASLAELNASPTARVDIGAALERQELPRTAAMLDACDPQIEWAPLEAEGKVFRGRRGIVRILEAWYEAMEEWHVEPEDIVDAGDSLLMRARIKARGRRSGLPIEQRGQAVFRMREGRVLRCEEFADLHAAREAAGLGDIRGSA